VLRHAEAIIARLKAAQADVAALVEGGAGTLRVGTFQSVGARILPELLRRFRPAWPAVEVQLKESASDPELLELVRRGDLDLAFAMPPLPDGPYEMTELMRDAWVLLVPAESPLAARAQPVSLREVAELPLIGARLCRSAEQLYAHFHARGLQPRYVFHSDENNTIHGLVAAGAGIALIPRLAVDENDDRVTAIELGPKVPNRVIAITWHRDRYRSPAAEAFVELSRALCGELEARAAGTVAAVA
jgi:DNA-binding transcriptional LysR family regulator